MQVYVRLNRTRRRHRSGRRRSRAPGVIALRSKKRSDGRGDVTVYLDPVALKATEELIEDRAQDRRRRTQQDGFLDSRGQRRARPRRLGVLRHSARRPAGARRPSRSAGADGVRLASNAIPSTPLSRRARSCSSIRTCSRSRARRAPSSRRRWRLASRRLRGLENDVADARRRRRHVIEAVNLAHVGRRARRA